MWGGGVSVEGWGSGGGVGAVWGGVERGVSVGGEGVGVGGRASGGVGVGGRAGVLRV